MKDRKLTSLEAKRNNMVGVTYIRQLFECSDHMVNKLRARPDFPKIAHFNGWQYFYNKDDVIAYKEKHFKNRNLEKLARENFDTIKIDKKTQETLRLSHQFFKILHEKNTTLLSS